MASTSPMVAQLEFSVRIRERRKELGLDAKSVSAHMGFSRNYYSAVENNRAILADDRLPELSTILGFDDETTTELAELLVASRKRGWWDDYSKLITDEMAQLYGLEDGASEIHIFEGIVVTGLLQTREYAEAIIRSDPKISAADASKFIEVRLRRQKRLTESRPPRMLVLMSEAALMLEVGGRAVLTDQLEYLLMAISTMGDRLELRIQPFAGAAAGIIGASTLVLLHFESRHMRTVVWREAVQPLGVSDDSDLVGDLVLGYERVLDSSLGVEDSYDLIRHKLRQLSS